MVKEGIEENAKKDQGRWCENDMKLGFLTQSKKKTKRKRKKPSDRCGSNNTH